MNDFNRLFDQLQSQFLGFDNFRDLLTVKSPIPSFPPINIYRENLNETTLTATGDYVVEVAVSGYEPDDVSVELQKVNGVNLLTIESKGNDRTKHKVQWFHHTIAGRAFKTSFVVANNVKVKTAEMKNGLLTIRLTVEEPVETVKRIPVIAA